jgi:hypothetical protein
LVVIGVLVRYLDVLRSYLRCCASDVFEGYRVVRIYGSRTCGCELLMSFGSWMSNCTLGAASEYTTFTASVVDSAIITCILDNQEIRPLVIYTDHPCDFRCCLCSAQSESESLVLATGPGHLRAVQVWSGQTVLFHCRTVRKRNLQLLGRPNP